MFLAVDFKSDIPIYIQLKQQIIEGIASGELKEGESLPSVRQMAEDIGINLHTVNKAYTLLKNDSFILMDRRNGAIINKKEDMIQSEYINKLTEDMTPIVAETFCRGISEKEFLDICQGIFRNYSGEK
jgi:GntR family transcriptional regulator